MFEGDSAHMCAEKFPLVSIGGSRGSSKRKFSFLPDKIAFTREMIGGNKFAPPCH